MSAILSASGFQNLESLQDFSLRFPEISGQLDSELKKLYICHKNIANIPNYSDDFCQEVYHNLYKIIENKLNSAKNFTALLNEFKGVSLCQKIHYHFTLSLTCYILNECYLFYNWGVNALEPVIDHLEIHEKIQNYEKLVATKRFGHKPKRIGKILDNENKSISIERKREKSVDLFDEFNCSKQGRSKKVTFNHYKNAVNSSAPFFDLARNSNDPFQETFGLRGILYDINQKPNWPKSHILSVNDIEKLMDFIIELPVNGIKSNFVHECRHWTKLKKLLGVFLKKHTEIEKNNGYGRILKKHLKNGGVDRDRNLRPISKSIVSSYILDILRRVLLLEFFGCNNLRKKFFSQIIKVINGTKDETFLWFTIVGVLLKNKSKIPWCNETSNNSIQNIIILKLFKFVILDYVFIILKNNFYVTETGSSGFGLRYYQKNCMESNSHEFLASLLYYNHLKKFKKQDHELFSLERKWVDDGVIEEKDIARKPRKIMSSENEFKQPIASIRFLPKNDWSNQVRMISNVKCPKTKILGSDPEGKKLLEVFKARSSSRKEKLFVVKLLLEYIIDKIGFGIKPVPSNPRLEVAWRKAISLKEKYGKLYFVKADIADAFDSVKHDVLIQIIEDFLAEESFEHPFQLKKITEWKSVGSKIKKVSRLSFSNRPKENSLLVNRTLDPDQIVKAHDFNFVDIIKQIVTEQRVEIRGRVFKLTKGLAQGSVGKFSPQLCEIYYSSMDRSYFSWIINSNDSILLRGVDDYLLITSDIRKGKTFLEVVDCGIQYFNARFKKDKLESNLIDNIQEIPYLGLIFNFIDMSVRPNYSKYQRKDLLSTMKLSDPWGNIHFNKNYFLRRKSLIINSLKLVPKLLSDNNLTTARQIVFKVCIMQSFRVLVLAKYLFHSRSRNDLVVCNVLFKSGVKIRQLMSVHPGLCKNEINWIFLFAVKCVFQKYSGVFQQLLVIIRYELQKCENILNEKGSLLLTFLKADLGHEYFWENVREIFGLIPFKM